LVFDSRVAALKPVVRRTCFVGLILAATALPARGQRVIFPTTVPDQPVYTTSQAPYAPPPSSPYISPTAPYNTVPASPPAAALNGTIQAPPGVPWDPYASPSDAVAPPAGVTPPYAQQPYVQPYTGQPYGAPGSPCGQPGCPTPFYSQATRFLQDVQISNTWIPQQINSNGFGIDSTVLNATFGIPTRLNAAPILITPGFNFHLLSGPDTTPPAMVPAPNLDLPGHLFDAYLGAAWRPQLTQTFGADLAVSGGIYSDFSTVNWDSVRVLGRALGVVTVSPQWQFEAGIVYLDRLNIKLLPAGGVIWTPNPDIKFNIVFPYPKLAWRFSTVGNTDIWGYIAGEYGGGQWSITHANGVEDVITYNDLRFLAGMEFFGLSRFRGNFEIGYAFNRQIIYRGSGAELNPGNAILFRGGLAF